MSNKIYKIFKIIKEDIINHTNEIWNYIDNNNINELYKYLNMNHPSKLILQKGLTYLLDEYQKNPSFYKFLEIFLCSRIDVNETFIYYNQNFTV